MKLDERMKKYEGVSKMFLTVGVPKVIRLDMRAGSTFTKHLKKPFDPVFSGAMEQAAQALCKQIQGAAFAYTQSDEISLILNDGVDKDTQTFFDGNVEKIVSISASLCTLEFNKVIAVLFRWCLQVKEKDTKKECGLRVSIAECLCFLTLQKYTTISYGVNRML